jgi:predicted transposase/invertase (TIGR01784 family)
MVLLPTLFILPSLKSIKEHFDTLPREFRVLALSYLGNCINQQEHSLKSLINLVAMNNQEKEEVMMSIAQGYIDKGMRQGRQQGVQQGMQQEKWSIARNMIHRDFSLDSVSNVTGLSQEELAKIALQD